MLVMHLLNFTFFALMWFVCKTSKKRCEKSLCQKKQQHHNVTHLYAATTKHCCDITTPLRYKNFKHYYTTRYESLEVYRTHHVCLSVQSCSVHIFLMETHCKFLHQTKIAYDLRMFFGQRPCEQVIGKKKFIIHTRSNPSLLRNVIGSFST